MAPILTVREIAARVNGTVEGDLNRPITGISSPAAAGPHDIIFIDSDRYVRQLADSRAGAALVPKGTQGPPAMALVAVDEPSRAMMHVADLLVPAQPRLEGVSSLAHIGSDAALGDGVGVGPFVSIGDRARIGARTQIHAGATIGPDTAIGDDCILYAGVHVYHDVTIGSRVILHSGVVIGADGFGYVQDRSPGDVDGDPLTHQKIRQIGRVVIEDDVEIGANSTVDRATYDATYIGRGTKIDNLVTVGHNCRIGRHCIIIGQVGISGSTTLGNYVVIAGQAGLTGHLTIGDGVVIGAQAGVTRSLKPGERVLGSPAVEGGRAKRALALVDSLPEFKKSIADHERRLKRIEGDAPPETSGEG